MLIDQYIYNSMKRQAEKAKARRKLTRQPGRSLTEELATLAIIVRRNLTERLKQASV